MKLCETSCNLGCPTYNLTCGSTCSTYKVHSVFVEVGRNIMCQQKRVSSLNKQTRWKNLNTNTCCPEGSDVRISMPHNFAVGCTKARGRAELAPILSIKIIGREVVKGEIAGNVQFSVNKYAYH